MRTVFAAAALSAVSLLAFAASPDESRPEARLYLNFNFGGAQQAVTPTLQYGLTVDHDRRFVDAATPPLMNFSFDATGFERASLNGLPMVQRYVLTQDEGETSAGEIAYTGADWGMIALGVVGVGFVASETMDVEEKTATSSSSGGGGGGGGGGGTPCITTVPTPLPPGCTP